MDSRIRADLKAHFGIEFHQMHPVTGGLLNQKWKIVTEQGELLVKQYSTKRFDRAKLERIESALERQVLLEAQGVPCPRLWQRQGRILRWIDEETVYMVMEFCVGRTQPAAATTLAQMRSLGSACARMHQAFSRLAVPPEPALPVSGGYTLELLRAPRADCPVDAPAAYWQARAALEPMIQALDPGSFDRFHLGYAHEDFHSGNILFEEDGVSAIVDFDRNGYSYPAHDIGRALLSFALEGQRLNTAKVRAFADGYAQHAPLTMQDLADALRLTWCIEQVWWIQPQYFGPCSATPQRFREEMQWLTGHWPDLDTLMG